MLTTKKNRFGHLLENLLYIAEIKNSSLAKALQYDVSYISKWINGRKLPAERNRKKILSCISHTIVSQCSAAGLRDLYDNYRVSTPTALEKVIYDNLEAEYNYVIDTKQTYGTTVPPETTFQPELTPSQYIMKMHHPVLRRVSSLHIMAQIDLLSLMHEHRLQIVQNNLRYDEYRDYRLHLFVGDGQRDVRLHREFSRGREEASRLRPELVCLETLAAGNIRRIYRCLPLRTVPVGMFYGERSDYPDSDVRFAHRYPVGTWEGDGFDVPLLFAFCRRCDRARADRDCLHVGFCRNVRLYFRYRDGIRAGRHLVSPGDGRRLARHRVGTPLADTAVETEGFTSEKQLIRVKR